jgi:hypothetical protein
MADHFFLLLCDGEIPKSILKALAITYFGFDLQGFLEFRELQLQFDDLSNVDVAGNGRAQSAFSKVFSSADQCFFCPDDDSQIQKVSGM